MSYKHNPARACVETRGLPGKCHRNNGIGAKAPTNFSSGGPSPFIRKNYPAPGQKPPTDANPVDQRKQLDQPAPGKLKGVK